MNSKLGKEELPEVVSDYENDDVPERQVALLKFIPSEIIEGKDEMNMAEFPLSAVSDRVDPNVKTLVFEDKLFDKSLNKFVNRKLTITGSDKYGLPTSTDEQVLLALVQITKLHLFTSRKVYFTRMQLLQILKWPPSGQNYARLEESLNRWLGVTLYYENAWRVKSQKWTNENFHMLDRVRIEKAKGGEGTTDGELSFFSWNEVVFRSFCDGNVKDLNYSYVLSLKSVTAKRLFRFLDKRFFLASKFEFDVKTLAYEKVGLSRNTPLADVKRKLNVAIDELEATAFLEPTPKNERYRKVGPGSWKVIFRKKLKAGEREEQEKLFSQNPLFKKLCDFGVSPEKARELIASHDASLIEKKLEIAIWMVEKTDARISKNPPGFLITSIENPNYKPPKQFELYIRDKELAAKGREIGESFRQLNEKREQEQNLREAIQAQAIEEFWACQTEEQRRSIEEEAIHSSTASQRKILKIGGKIAEVLKKSLIDSFILQRLAEQK